MQPSRKIIDYWLKAQSEEIQLLLKNKSVKEIKYLMQVIESFNEDKCKKILSVLAKNQDSRLEFQSLF